MSHVLVCRLDNNGDVLLAGPAIRAVAAVRGPVTLLCGPRGRPAAELLPGVERILEMRAPWIEPDPIPVRRADADRVVDELRRLDVGEALILGSSHQSPLPLALLLRWAGVERIAAVSHEHAGALLDVRIPRDPDVHEVVRNLKVAEALGYPPPADDRLAVSVSAGHPVGRGTRGAGLVRGPDGLRPYVVMHPGASVPARTLTPDRWRAAVRALADRGWAVAVTGTAQERHLTAAVAEDRPYVSDLGGHTTFRALAHLLDRATAFVGGNSGPAHLAAAVDTPVVSVFPPTVPLARWRPWRVRHVVLGDQAVPCAGCRSRRCPWPEQECLAPVDAEAIVDAVETVASAPPGTPPPAAPRTPEAPEGQVVRAP